MARPIVLTALLPGMSDDKSATRNVLMVLCASLESPVICFVGSGIRMISSMCIYQSCMAALLLKLKSALHFILQNLRLGSSKSAASFSWLL